MKEEKNTVFTDEDLKILREKLPGKYYPQFKKIWETKFKGEKCPKSQNVYSVKAGLSQNDRIIEVLIQLVTDRIELRDKLREKMKGVSDMQQ